MSTHDALWGDLRSILNLPGHANEARWTRLLDCLAQFSHEDERQAAIHHAAQAISHHESWPAELCSWTSKNHALPEAWQVPLIKAIRLDRRCDDAFLHELFTMPGLHLARLSLSGWVIHTESLRSLLDQPATQTLTSLEISGYKPDTTHEEKIPALGRLDAFTLHSVDDAGAHTTAELLGQCAHVTRLGLHGSIHKSTSWRQLLGTLATPLLHLNMSGLVAKKGVDALINAGVLRTVEHLNLERCNLGSPGAKALLQADNTCLRHLNFANNDIGSTGLAAIEHATYSHSLRELVLQWNSLRTISKSVNAMLASGVVPNLELLDLEETDLNSASCARLFAEPMIALHTLSLARCNVGKRGIRALVDGQLPALRTLDLRWCRLDDDAIEVLVEGRWPALESINVWQHEHEIAQTLCEAMREAWGDEVVIQVSG